MQKLFKNVIPPKYNAQRGLGLAETLVAVAILGTAGTAFISGLSAGALSTGAHETLAVSQGIAQSQMEYSKSYTYNSAAVTYPTVAVPPGYSVSVSVTSVPGTDVNIQKITVSVSGNGNTLTLQGYKVNR
jgi:Tfp pilus assembly protein PilV